MSEPIAARVLLCTVPDRDAADRLAGELLEAGCAACVNVLAGVSSIYRWKGEIQKDEELLLVIKTDRERVGPAIEVIEGAHPYECPEAIALPVTEGSEAYLGWIRDEVGRG